MNRVKIGITAIALMVGAISAFASKATKFAGTYWTTAGSTTHYTTRPAACNGGSILCAAQHTLNGTLTSVINKVK
jgi:hypothetical protein